MGLKGLTTQINSNNGGSGPVYRDCEIRACGRSIVVPVYVPEFETAIFVKEGMKSLDTETVLPLMSIGLRVVNSDDPGAVIEALSAGQPVTRWESYCPPGERVARMNPSRRGKLSDAESAERIRAEMPPGPQRDAALAYFENRGRDGFTQAERDRAGKSRDRSRRKLERLIGRDAADGLTDEEVCMRLQAESLRKSYANQPDIDGDFDKKGVTDV